MHFLIGLGLLIALAMALNSEKGRKVLGTMFLIVLGVVGAIALLIMWAVQQGKSPPPDSAEQAPLAISSGSPPAAPDFSTWVTSGEPMTLEQVLALPPNDAGQAQPAAPSPAP